MVGKHEMKPHKKHKKIKIIIPRSARSVWSKPLTSEAFAQRRASVTSASLNTFV